MKFEVKDRDFILDGNPIKIISASVHYFRNLPDTWDDIFSKLVALGCNCVETYCAWNMHEKVKGEFDFSGGLNVAEFLRKAHSYGLMAIVRPGPYICAEWEFGGLPWWIQAEEVNLRCMDEKYIEYFDRYLDKMFDEIRPLLCTNGGPVIMVACENEYGYYGDDVAYRNYLRDGYIKRGIDVPLFTADGSEKKLLLDGAIEGCIPTLNFGSRAKEHYDNLEEVFPGSPRMVMEMWNGWFDEWGDSFHHTTSVEDYVKSVDEALSMGSMNMYMFIGGTNFGFMNGANHGDSYCPHVTSYDYDSLLTESGDVTEKYMAIREVIKKYTGKEPLPVPPNRPKKAYGRVDFTDTASLFDNMDVLSKPIQSKVPENMEKYAVGYGYIAYTTVLNRDYEDAILSFDGIGDRAQVYIGRDLKGCVYVNDEKYEVTFSAKKGDVLTILCENMGRCNFGTKMMRKKGIDGRCMIDNKIHFDWTVYPLGMDNLEKLVYGDKAEQKACFLKAEFTIDEPCDTFLKLEGFTKGFAVINGFNLGRHWCVGPQRTLFVPKSVLREGKNELVVFDSDGVDEGAYALFADVPDIGK